MSSNRCSIRPAVVALFAVVGLTACDLGSVTLTPQPAGLIVHSILNSQVQYQTLLLERALNGAVYPAGPQGVLPVDPNEAIITDGGVPEKGAIVELVVPDGRVIRAAELDTCFRVVSPPEKPCPSYFPMENGGGNGAGMYIFDFDGANLVPGGHYQLRIASSEGELVTGDMIFPPSLASSGTPTLSYSRDTAAVLAWPTTPPAAAYQVRVESPYGVWLSVTDRASATLSGGLRNVNLTDLPHVFIPGFRQAVSVSAVDANVYDYYRTSSNSATGAGILSRLHGARGVFGGIVTVDRRILNVTASPKLPVEGTYVADTSAVGYLYGPYSITLFVESEAARDGQGSVVVMRANPRPTAPPSVVSVGYLGTLTGSRLVVDLGNPLTTGDELVADIRGDTIIGHYSKGAPAKFVRH